MESKGKDNHSMVKNVVHNVHTLDSVGICCVWNFHSIYSHSILQDLLMFHEVLDNNEEA